MANEELVIRGVLAMAVRISAVSGLTPLSITKTQDGYWAKVSKSAKLYGYCVAAALATTAIVLQVWLEVLRNFYETTVENYFIRLVGTNFFIIIHCWTASQTSKRLKRMLNYIETLDKNNVGKHGWRLNRKRFVLILTLVTPFVTLWPTINFLINPTDEKILISLQLVGNISFILMLFQHVVYLVIYWEVSSNLEAISDALSVSVASNSPDDNFRTINTCVAKYSRVYCSLCELVSQMNEQESTVWCMLYFMMAVRVMDKGSDILFVSYMILTKGKTNEAIGQMEMISQTTLLVVQILHFFCLMEPFHKLELEVERIKHLLADITYRYTKVAAPMSVGINAFFAQLIFVRPSISPLGLFSLSRSLFMTILSVLVSYIIVQLQIKLAMTENVEKVQ